MNRLARRPASISVAGISVAAFAGLVGVGLFIGSGAGMKVTLLSLLVVAGLWALVLLARVGLVRLAVFALGAAAFFAPMNDLRPTAALTVSDVFLLAAAALVALDVLAGRRPLRLPLPGSTAVLGGLVVLGGGMVGTLVAGQQRAESLTNLARFGAAAVGAMVVVLLLAPNLRVIRGVMVAWLAGASLSVIVGLSASHRVAGRSLGLTTHPNHLGLVSALSAPVALAFALKLRGWRRAVAIAAFLITSFGVTESGSRAALVGFTVSILFVLARLNSPRAFAVTMVVVVSLAVALAGGVVHLSSEGSVNRLLDASETAGSDAGREEGLSVTIRTIESYPITGIGFERAKQGHNVYLQIWAAAGVLGLAGFLVIMGATVRGSWRATRILHGRDRTGVALMVGMGSGLVGFLVASAFQNVVWDRYLWLYTAFILAAVVDANALRDSVTGTDASADVALGTLSDRQAVDARVERLDPSDQPVGLMPGRHGS